MVKRVQRFGGAHTTKKQSVVVEYLAAYARALKDKGFHLSYVDAFAGCGARIDSSIRSPESDLFASNDVPIVRSSTAVEAVRLNPGFDRYVFGDRSDGHLRSLVETIRANGGPARAGAELSFVRADANVLVEQECAWLRSGRDRRAVVFLDPYGMQVNWTTLQQIAACERADLWLLLPTGIAINRLIPRGGEPHPRWEERLDAFYGTEDWRDAFRPVVQDLLGAERRRTANLDAIVAYTLKRLHSLFGDGLYQPSLSLRAGKKQQQYHLVFAATSTNSRAREVAHKIAAYLIARESRR